MRREGEELVRRGGGADDPQSLLQEEELVRRVDREVGDELGGDGGGGGEADAVVEGLEDDDLHVADGARAHRVRDGAARVAGEEVGEVGEPHEDRVEEELAGEAKARDRGDRKVGDEVRAREHEAVERVHADRDGLEADVGLLARPLQDVEGVLALVVAKAGRAEDGVRALVVVLGARGAQDLVEAVRLEKVGGDGLEHLLGEAAVGAGVGERGRGRRRRRQVRVGAGRGRGRVAPPAVRRRGGGKAARLVAAAAIADVAVAVLEDLVAVQARLHRAGLDDGKKM